MKYIRYLTLLAGMLLLTHNICADEYDFRKTRWGMSITQVKEIENDPKWRWGMAELPETDSRLTVNYNGSIFNRECDITYSFSYRKLIGGFYTFDVENLSTQDLKQLYDDILNTLSDKYGKGTPVKNTGMEWRTINKRTLVRLGYHAESSLVTISYSLLRSPTKSPGNSKNTSADEYDFRKVRWGMSIAQVKAIEKLDPKWKLSNTQLPTSSALTAISYRGSIFNRECSLIYHFTLDKLAGAVYSFFTKYLSNTELRKLYGDIANALSDKYGQATTFGDTGMRWQAANKRTKIELIYEAGSNIVIINYIPLLESPTESPSNPNNTPAEEAF